MRNSKKSGKKSIEAAGELRARKVKLVRRSSGGLESVSHNIAKNKNTNKEIVDKAWHQWETTFDAIKDPVLLVDSEFRIVQANLATSRFLDRTLDEIVGRTCWQLVHGTDEPPEKCPLKKAKSSKKCEEIELHLPKKNIWIESLVDPILDGQGNVSRAVHIIRNITDRKKAEDALREQNEILHTILDNIPVMIAFLDSNGKHKWINQAWQNTLGWSLEEAQSRDVLKDFYPDPQYYQYVVDFISKAESKWGDFRTRRRDGTVLDTTWTNVPLSDGSNIGIGIDITERRKAEQALQDSQALYASLVENLQQYIFRKDLEGRFTFGNKRFCETLDRPLDEIIGKTDFDFYPAQLAEKYRRDDQNVIETGQVFDTVEEHQLSNGKKIYVQVVKTPLYDSAGKVIGTQGIFWDITERKKAEQTLRKEKDKVQTYLDVAAVMMVAIDCEGRVGLINKKGCQILGYDENEILAKNWFDNFLPKSVRDEVKDIFDKVSTGQADEPEYYENPVLTKNGDERLIAWHNTILRDDKGNVIATLSSGEDITERKKAEEKLLEYQKQLKTMASQLTLAEESERRRIATELHASIGQSLVISKMKLDELRASNPSSEINKTLGEVCDLLARTIQGARTLTFDLSSPVLYELGFEKAVAEWISEQIEKKHGIKTEFQDDGQEKPLDDEMKVFLFRDMRELLFNVIRHAQAKKVKVSIRKVDERIHVTVEDDGWGFDSAKVSEMAVKTGSFGLFSVRQRLELLGGRLDIESAPGHGCKVTITAPLKQKENS